jgi:hypothetical protein
MQAAARLDVGRKWRRGKLLVAGGGRGELLDGKRRHASCWTAGGGLGELLVQGGTRHIIVPSSTWQVRPSVLVLHLMCVYLCILKSIDGFEQ